jgi:uncharacterized protein YkwD
VPRQSPASPAVRTSTSVLSWRRSIRPVAVCALLICGGMAVAPSALADSVTRVQDAMATARAGTSCQPLSYNPVVEKAAAIINQSTDDYIDHISTYQPITDPMPGLKDLGYGGNKAALLQGALSNEADAIKGALLQGHAAIADCSYTDLGIDVRRNEATDNVLVVYLLAGA